MNVAEPLAPVAFSAHRIDVKIYAKTSIFTKFAFLCFRQKLMIFLMIFWKNRFLHYRLFKSAGRGIIFSTQKHQKSKFRIPDFVNQISENRNFLSCPKTSNLARVFSFHIFVFLIFLIKSIKTIGRAIIFAMFDFAFAQL